MEDLAPYAATTRRAGLTSPRRLSTAARWSRMTGASSAVRRLEIAILRVAEFQCTTLITGETGCGKEEVARAIHAAGPRWAKPFVTINCGGLTASLAESQLFGHEKGAFTGAIEATVGAFRAADGGVLFLDEIGEMPAEIQPQLLQVLERREVTPVGSTRPETVDVQVIAATNRDLDAQVKRCAFREDLLFRLNTVHLEVPPLRDRQEDISRFISHFSAHYAAMYDRPVWQPEPDVLGRLMAYDWPGNVRQLAQTIQRLYVFADAADLVLDELLGPDRTHSPRRPMESPPRAAVLASLAAPPPTTAEPETFNLKEVRRRTVRAALAATHGRFKQAAQLLGVCPNTMTKLVAEACPDLVANRSRRPHLPR